MASTSKASKGKFKPLEKLGSLGKSVAQELLGGARSHQPSKGGDMIPPFGRGGAARLKTSVYGTTPQVFSMANTARGVPPKADSFGGCPGNPFPVAATLAYEDNDSIYPIGPGSSGALLSTASKPTSNGSHVPIQSPQRKAFAPTPVLGRLSEATTTDHYQSEITIDDISLLRGPYDQFGVDGFLPVPQPRHLEREPLNVGSSSAQNLATSFRLPSCFNSFDCSASGLSGGGTEFIARRTTSSEVHGITFSRSHTNPDRHLSRLPPSPPASLPQIPPLHTAPADLLDTTRSLEFGFTGRDRSSNLPVRCASRDSWDITPSLPPAPLGAPPSPPLIGLDLTGISPRLHPISIILEDTRSARAEDHPPGSPLAAQQTLELFLSMAQQNLKLIQATQARIFQQRCDHSVLVHAAQSTAEFPRQASHLDPLPDNRPETSGRSEVQGHPTKQVPLELTRGRPRALTFGQDGASVGRRQSQRSREIQGKQCAFPSPPGPPPSRDFIDTRSRANSMTHKSRRPYSCHSDVAFSECRSVIARPHSWIAEVRGCWDELALDGESDGLTIAMAQLGVSCEGDEGGGGRSWLSRSRTVSIRSVAHSRSSLAVRRRSSSLHLKSKAGRRQQGPGLEPADAIPPLPSIHLSTFMPQQLSISSGSQRPQRTTPRGPRPRETTGRS